MLPAVALLVLIALALTSYRLTRLLVVDEFPPIKVQRVRLAQRWGESSSLTYLSRCPWCAGVWVAGMLTLATWLAVDTMPVPLLQWGAAAAVTGFLASHEGGD
jgi:hypothetical protein